MSDDRPHYQIATETFHNIADKVKTRGWLRAVDKLSDFLINSALVIFAGIFVGLPVLGMIVVCAIPLIYIGLNYAYHTYKASQKEFEDSVAKQMALFQSSLPIINAISYKQINNMAIETTQSIASKTADTIYFVPYRGITKKAYPALFHLIENHLNEFREIQKELAQVILAHKLSDEFFDSLQKKISEIDKKSDKQPGINAHNVIEDIKELIGYPNQDPTRAYPPRGTAYSNMEKLHKNHHATIYQEIEGILRQTSTPDNKMDQIKAYIEPLRILTEHEKGNILYDIKNYLNDITPQNLKKRIALFNKSLPQAYYTAVRVGSMQNSIFRVTDDYKLDREMLAQSEQRVADGLVKQMKIALPYHCLRIISESK